MTLALFVAGLGGVGSVPASAQSPDEGPEANRAMGLDVGVAASEMRTRTASASASGPGRGRVPHEDPRLQVGRAWPAGMVRTQLDRDGNMIPFGKGAIFVPAMTSGLDEPPVAILKGGEQVAEGTSGQRIVLAPGTYTVRIGSGSGQQRLSVQATVRELGTTIVPVSWSALTVHVVDERYSSLRASYELIRVEDREYMGIGFGTDEQAGEPVSTWVLRPGLYKIVRVGENYRSRRNFATVRLLPGKHSHFLLVLDEETGDYRGGGEVPADELFRPQLGGFFGSLVIGGDVNMTHRSNVLGAQDGIAFNAEGFIDGRLSLELFDNPLIMRLQVEEGITNNPNVPLQFDLDRIDLDTLYVYRIEPWIGPYLRFGLETNLFDNQAYLGREFNVIKRNASGEVLVDEDTDNPRLRPSLGFISVREGLGLNMRAVKTVGAEVNVRAGLGARHRITNNLYELDPCSGDPSSNQYTLDSSCQRYADPASGLDTIVYQQVLGADQVGAELILLATFRLTRYLLLNFEVDSLVTYPLEDSIIEAEGSLLLKLTSFLSLNYVVEFTRDPQLAVGDPNRIVNDIFLRFSVDLP